MGIAWHVGKPVSNYQIGDCYIDQQSNNMYMWNGTDWVQVSEDSGIEPPMQNYEPSQSDLEKFPSLKEAWEEFLSIRKLLGIK